MRLARLLLACLALMATVRAGAAGWEPIGPGIKGLATQPVGAGKTGFTLLPGNQTGLAFTNQVAEERSITNRVLLLGSGVAAGDVDGDGLADLYFCSLDGDNHLYKNLGGWKFEELGAGTAIACKGDDSTGALLQDVDGDGDLDLLVSGIGAGVRLFLNDGKGHFTENTLAAGLSARSGAASLAMADIDGDGDLDLYVCNYRTNSIQDQPKVDFVLNNVGGRQVLVSVNGQPATSPELTNRFAISPTGDVLELGEVDVLYLNDGAGHFAAASWTDGRFLDEYGKALTSPPRDWGLACQFHDLNNDGLPDLYVCNDFFTPDRIWINQGGGKFRELSALGMRHGPRFSMAVDCGDLNRDGNVDIFAVDMLSHDRAYRHVQVADFKASVAPIGLIDNRPQLMRNGLQISRGDLSYAETSMFSGVDATDWSWGAAFLDVDLDGYEDVLVINGQWGDFMNADMAAKIEGLKISKKLPVDEITKLVRLYPRLATPNLAFRNRGDLTFQETGGSWGFNTAVISQGMCLVDLDNDGDMDVVVNNLNEQAGLYRNDSDAPRLSIRLRGAGKNTQGIGAKIEVTGGPVAQSQEMISGGRYLSGDWPQRTFAAGKAESIVATIRWPSGNRTTLTNAKPGFVYEISESSASPAIVEKKTPPAKMFEDVSLRIAHSHHEDPYDDFERQPLLPRRLSQQGPGVAWGDLNGDGFPDLIIGTGRGGRPGIFLGNGKGDFSEVRDPYAGKVLARDTLGIATLGSTILLASSNYEDGMTNGGALRILDTARKGTGESVSGTGVSVGTLALADVDGDGSLEIFAGGRVVPGAFPEAADSLLLKNEKGRFVVAHRFEKLGLVNSAIFSDLDNDGTPELIVACEWGPINIYQFKNGQWTETTKAWGLESETGLWNGVTVGDFNEDGLMDIVASNWGLNTQYGNSPGRKLFLHYADWDDNGTKDIVEGYLDPNETHEWPIRGYKPLGDALPFVKEAIHSYTEFGVSDIARILGERLKTSPKLQANVLETSLFLNKGTTFQRIPLPLEAQLAPAFGISVADFNNDGHQDLILAQNFFANQPEAARYDAGRGLLLLGDGKGGFKPVPGQESGILAYGEQRGSAVADFDGDGRMDVAITQNGGSTLLFKNATTEPGVRVEIKGSAANPQGIGTRLRLLDESKEGTGPNWEIHQGSGFLSQDSPLVILPKTKQARSLKVTWPDGKLSTNQIPAGATNIVLQPANP